MPLQKFECLHHKYVTLLYSLERTLVNHNRTDVGVNYQSFYSNPGVLFSDDDYKIWLVLNYRHLTPTSVPLWSARVISGVYSKICYLATQKSSIGCFYYSDNRLSITKCKLLVWAPEPKSTVALPLSPQLAPQLKLLINFISESTQISLISCITHVHLRHLRLNHLLTVFI